MYNIGISFWFLINLVIGIPIDVKLKLCVEWKLVNFFKYKTLVVLLIGNFSAILFFDIESYSGNWMSVHDEVWGCSQIKANKCCQFSQHTVVILHI